jgi:hypothetical protein
MLTRLLPAAAAAVAVLGAAAAAADPAPPPGFTALFNGKDFTGWHGWAIHAKGGSPVDLAKLSADEKAKLVADWTEDMKRNWRIEDGELVNTGKGAYPATDREYGDAEFLIDWKISPTVDSGVYVKTMPQVQVWDPTDADPRNFGKAKGSGGLWNNPPGWPGKDPLARADKPAGEWNTFRILVLGDRVTIHLNGQLVIDHARLANYWQKGMPLPARASLLLQTHPPEREIRWRNIYAREVPPAEANAILAKKVGDGFKEVFNGQNLTGWAGAVDNYEVKDGAIVCKPKKGGTLYTEAEFADFEAAVEFKLPPAGNNGLAIRYPGTGDPAYSGMCELQVLDTEHPNYKKIDPRQAHGSAYGMVPAYRGYLRPTGEWNFEHVVVKGSTITVDLNGSRILDCDLSKVTEFMADSPHPGKDRKSGHFGFAGHNDPVAFRNVRIKRLD